MKKLNLFQRFDFSAWQTGKKFMVQSAKYNEKKGCVTLDVVIVEDNTNYGDSSVSNVFEKFKVHCVQSTHENDVQQYQSRSVIKFISVGKCSVWGDYASNLSVEAVVEVVNK